MALAPYGAWEIQEDSADQIQRTLRSLLHSSATRLEAKARRATQKNKKEQKKNRKEQKNNKKRTKNNRKRTKNNRKRTSPHGASGGASWVASWVAWRGGPKRPYGAWEIQEDSADQTQP